MLKILTVASVAAFSLVLSVAAKPANAENGQIAAGVIGGLAVGAIVGSQVGRNEGYRGDGGYYRASGYRGRECYIERRDFEDRYGRIHVRNVRVCN